MKKYWLVVLLLLAAAMVVMLLFWQSHPPATATPPPDIPATGSAGNAPAASAESPPANVVSAPPTLAGQAGEMRPAADMATNIPPLVILQNARRAIIQYAQAYGGNPVGTNPEITAALLGENPRHIHFITPDSGLRTNARGELLDAWGTPLFFHQLSGHDMEIRSAGEDRQMWTFDDLLLH